VIKKRTKGIDRPVRPPQETALLHQVAAKIEFLAKEISDEQEQQGERWESVHDQIVELVALDNAESRTKLRDGSEHRSSRTYAAALANRLLSSANTGVSFDKK
jgi:hypothetical protein